MRYQWVLTFLCVFFFDKTLGMEKKEEDPCKVWQPIAEAVIEGRLTNIEISDLASFIARSGCQTLKGIIDAPKNEIYRRAGAKVKSAWFNVIVEIIPGLEKYFPRSSTYTLSMQEDKKKGRGWFRN